MPPCLLFSIWRQFSDVSVGGALFYGPHILESGRRQTFTKILTDSVHSNPGCFHPKRSVSPLGCMPAVTDDVISNTPRRNRALWQSTRQFANHLELLFNNIYDLYWSHNAQNPNTQQSGWETDQGPATQRMRHQGTDIEFSIWIIFWPRQRRHTNVNWCRIDINSTSEYRIYVNQNRFIGHCLISPFTICVELFKRWSISIAPENWIQANRNRCHVRLDFESCMLENKLLLLALLVQKIGSPFIRVLNQLIQDYHVEVESSLCASWSTTINMHAKHACWWLLNSITVPC